MNNHITQENNSINSDYYDDDHDDEDDNYSDLIYTRFSIAICELFNEKIHGNTSTYVKYNYLVNTRFKYFNIKYINDYVNFINNKYANLHNFHHSIFKNYRNIVLNSNYIKPEIVECFYIDSYCIAIFKTFWIKIIQRTWKNILKKRNEIILKRMNPSSLFYKERNGKWSNDCLHFPTLKGMLSSLT